MLHIKIHKGIVGQMGFFFGWRQFDLVVLQTALQEYRSGSGNAVPSRHPEHRAI
jgi:hypothetical protein